MQAKTEEGQRIESLQQEIEKVEGDICQKSHYTRQLEHMLLRLRSNQVIQICTLQTNNASGKKRCM
jgi:septal ring factor EnvC (AmiA/AmiB activator)